MQSPQLWQVKESFEIPARLDLQHVLTYKETANPDEPPQKEYAALTPVSMPAPMNAGVHSQTQP